MASPPETEEQGDTVREAFARLYADGRAYADAEIDRQKLRAGIAVVGIRDAAILGVASFLLVFGGLVAFLVGIVLLLTPHLGAGWAAAAVFGCTVVIAVILLLIARARIGKMRKAIR